MLLLTLFALALFVAALFYFVILVVGETLTWAQCVLSAYGRHQREVSPLVSSLRTATQEISAILGLGDD